MTQERQPSERINGPRTQKAIILRFWRKFGGKKSKGEGFSKPEKIQALIRLSRFVIPYRNQKPSKARREDFNEAKFKLHPWRRFGDCFVCSNPATARHHIIQLQNGGINSKKNLVSLCDDCHAIIHPWLKPPQAFKPDMPTLSL